jgi:tetratricopeptide (TPR) repeat protein
MDAERPRSAERVWWGLALACVGLAVPLRLLGFVGYGLGDDGNFIAAAVDFLEYGRLDLSNHYHARPLFILPHALAFRVLGVSELSFVLPVFLAALGTHLLGIGIARAAFGARGAFFVSALWLTTPFETLTATAGAPDHELALLLTAAVACCLVGHRSARPAWMIGGAFLVLCGVAVKAPALGILPSFALATALAGRRWGRWLPFWGTLAVAAAAAGLALVAFGTGAEGWLGRLLEGTRPVPDAEAFAVYPRLLWHRDEFGRFMFGAAGWLAAAGLLASGWRTHGAWPRGAGLVVLAGSYLAVFLGMAGSVEFARIFRYLAQVTPAVYLCGGFFLEQVARRTPALAFSGLALAAAFGLQQTPLVTESVRDPNRDGRVLTAFLAEQDIPRSAVIQGDFWSCARVRWLLDPASRAWKFDCPTFRSAREKRAFLANVQGGYVITGGGSLAWYATGDWRLDLRHARFRPPKPGASEVTWERLLEHDGPRRPWRREPLRVWRIVDADQERIVEIPDPELRRCLRRAVFPGSGGADDPAQPITVGLAREPRFLHCARAGIRDGRGLEAFVGARELVLSHNELERIDLTALRQLRLAVLNGNRLQQVDGLREAPALEVLWLSHNALERVELGVLPRLRDLRLEHNRLTAIEVHAPLTGLATLALWANPGLACNAAPLPAALVATSGCGRAAGDLAARLPALDAPAHSQLAWLLGSYGAREDLAEAIAHARAALALAPTAPRHDSLGGLHARAGDLERAVEAYTRALAVDDTYFYAYRNRAQARLGLGDRAGALRDYRRWAEHAPTPAERALAEAALARAQPAD